MATKTIVRYRNPPKKRTHRRSGGMTIPVAAVAGFVPMLSTPLKMYMGGAWEAGNWHLIANTTGINKDTGQFMWPYFMKSWGPVLAGVLVHKIVGQKFGINRLLSSAGVPFFRV